MLRKRAFWVFAAILAIVALFLLGKRVAGYIPLFAAWVESLGAIGPIVFILGYVVATVAFVPGSLLTLTGGAVFGIVRGTLYVMIAASLGATAAFLVSRYVARDRLVRRFEHSARFRAIDEAVRLQGRKIVFLLRLSPLFPFNMLNYALGLTSVHLKDYVIACAGMLPVAIMWVYYGRVIGDVARVVSGVKIAHGKGYWAMLVFGLIATVVATAVITRTAKRALTEAMEDQ